VAFDAGVAREGIRAADEHGHTRLAKDAQRVAVELFACGLQDLVAHGSHAWYSCEGKKWARFLRLKTGDD
jgi:hypothetical protein